MATLQNANGFVISTPRTGSNNSFDFLLFLTVLVSAGQLVAGDVLVLDNAPVHYSAAIAAPLNLLLLSAGVRLLFLPTYSPELNPCEHIFAQIKHHLRIHRSPQPLPVDIFTACSTVTVFNVLAYYDKCITHPRE
jgi:transposase